MIYGKLRSTIDINEFYVKNILQMSFKKFGDNSNQ